jgi:hypothetical protein
VGVHEARGVCEACERVRIRVSECCERGRHAQLSRVIEGREDVRLV